MYQKIIITKTNMNTDKIFTKLEPSYEAPFVNVLDVQAEGVLCGSGDFGIKDWENDDDSLDF